MLPGFDVLAREALQADILGVGAVHVRELAPDDWPAFPSWAALKLLEQRRLLGALEKVPMH